MDQATMERYLLKLESFRKTDTERERLITEVLGEYHTLLAEYQRKCDDYANEVESRRMWQQKESIAREEVKESRYAIVSLTKLHCIYGLGWGDLSGDVIFS